MAFRWSAIAGVKAGKAADASADGWGWLKSARLGDERCAALLVRQLTPQALGMAWQLLGRLEEAEDAVQDSYVRLWKSQAQDGHGARLSTYFNTIVINQCRTRMKARHELSVDPADLTMLQDSQQTVRAAEEAFDGARSWSLGIDTPLTRGLAQLPARQRLALVMWAYADATIDDIAQALDLVPNAAHQVLYRAKRSLRERLEGTST